MSINFIEFIVDSLTEIIQSNEVLTPQTRYNLIDEFLGIEKQLVNQIDFGVSGGKRDFVKELIEKCLRYRNRIDGFPALIYFLNALRNSNSIGIQYKDQLQDLINYAYALTTYHLVIISNNNIENFCPFNDEFVRMKNNIVTRYINSARRFSTDFEIPNCSCFFYNCDKLGKIYDRIATHFKLEKCMAILIDCSIFSEINNSSCTSTVVTMIEKLYDDNPYTHLNIGKIGNNQCIISNKIKYRSELQELLNEEDVYRFISTQYVQTRLTESRIRMENEIIQVEKRSYRVLE